MPLLLLAANRGQSPGLLPFSGPHYQSICPQHLDLLHSILQLLPLGLNTEGRVSKRTWRVQPSQRAVGLGRRSRRDERERGVFREERGIEMAAIRRGTGSRGPGRQGHKARRMSPSGSMVTWSSRSVCPPLSRSLIPEVEAGVGLPERVGRGRAGLVFRRGLAVLLPDPR